MGMSLCATRHNPFKPSFGASPYYLAGREELLQHFELRGLRELAQLVTETGILITLDELQSAHIDQLHRLATAVQDLMRDDLNISLACAGLPHGIDTLLQHEGTTFLRRTYRVDLHEVSDTEVSNTEVSKTLDITAADSGRPFYHRGSRKSRTTVPRLPLFNTAGGALS